jgi:hypothetical protein
LERAALRALRTETNNLNFTKSTSSLDGKSDATGEAMSKTPLHLDYTLQDHGWATTVFTVGDQRFEFVNAYGSDSIGELAQLAIRWSAQSGVSKTEVVFDCENRGEYIAIFKHRDPSEFAFFHQRMGGPDGSNAPRSELAACEIDSFAFAINIARVLDDLLRTHGFVGYLRKWQYYAFPFREYLFLRLLLDQSPIIAKIASSPPVSSLELELQLLNHEPIWGTSPRTNALASLELPLVL